MVMVRRLLLVVLVLFVLGSMLELAHRALSDPPAGPIGEYRAPQEDLILSRLMAGGVKIVNANVTKGTYHRDAHPKTHGCVLSTFIIEPPAWPLNQGPFSKPGSYKAWIRFSSGNPLIQSDWLPDARGMAIKILGISQNSDGPLNQDFVMIDNPVFMLRNMEEYAAFSSYQVASTVQHSATLMFKYFFLGPDNQLSLNPFSWRLRELLLGVTILKWPPKSLLKTRFHSMTAYRLGTAGYIKFSAKPAACKATQGLSAWSLVALKKNALGEDLANRVKQGPAYCFDFLIQPQRQDRHMPVEDPTVKWKESDSPFIKVGQIEISSQQIDAAPESGFCEDLSFSPFRGMPEFQPVGGLNRIREAVYASISAYRHCMNGLNTGEPRQDGTRSFEPKNCRADAGEAIPQSTR